jgi:alkylated DNA repair dioxygenase AlkB
LGASRRFRLKHKKGASVFSESLPGGSLLIMAGETQKHFLHEISKEKSAVGPRINLTFRRIRLAGEQ